MSEVLFVGTSDAFGAGGRRQSAVLVRGQRGTLLLDCGSTTGSGLGELGVDRDEIETILVSHFHGDHFGGIPLLLLAALYQDKRKHALHIAGPPDIENRVRTLARALGHSIEDRDWTFPIHFTEVPAGAEYEIGPARIRSFDTRHQIEAHPQGYRVETGGQTIAYSGDTGWFPELPRLVPGASAAFGRCRPLHLRMHAPPRDPRVSPEPRDDRGAPARLRLRAAGAHPPGRRDDGPAGPRVHRDGRRRSRDQDLALIRHANQG